MNFQKIETFGKSKLEKYPFPKKVMKRLYQRTCYLLERNKFKSKGNLFRISPNDGYEYFYGYYDKSPWDENNRYIISMKVNDTTHSVAPKEKAEIVLIDTMDDHKVISVGTTKAWNVQQGSMAQWIGPDYKDRMIYNDFRNGQYCSVIYNVKEKREEKTLSLPIYDISRDGKFALSLDFSRLHRMRPGYGYSNLKDRTLKDSCPDSPCIWKIDIENNIIIPLFTYSDIAAFQPKRTMLGAEHKVNHIMISPSGKRFMFLHRWYQDGVKHSRLVTVNIDGTQMYNLSDDQFISHSYWKNDRLILSFLRKQGEGDRYYLLEDQSKKYKMLWPSLNTDGHCSYSPDNRYIITDTYPNRKRIASLYLCRENKFTGTYQRIAQVFVPFRYDNETRCDLHPRWNRAGNEICIDSTHEGKRGLYSISLKDRQISVINDTINPYASVIIPCYNASSTIEQSLKSLEQQSFKNFEVIIIDDGSEDNSVEVIDNQRKVSDLTMVYKRQENQGVSSARNSGLELATGKYIFFLDADDVYHPLFLEKAISLCDHLKVSSLLVHDERNIEKILRGEGMIERSPELKEISDYMDYFMYNKGTIHFSGMAYKKEILDRYEIRFTSGVKYGEDLEFAWKYLANCEEGVVIRDKLYGYYDNPEGAVRTVRWEKVHLVEAMKRVENYLQERNHPFAKQFSEYMLPRTVWTTAKTFASGKRKDFYDIFTEKYEISKDMAKLTKSAQSRLLKISAYLYLINKDLFYYAIKIIYKYR